MCCYTIHKGEHALEAETYPNDDARYCWCRGTSKGIGNSVDDSKCCGASTNEEDHLCDRCRSGCQPVKVETATSVNDITVMESVNA